MTESNPPQPQASSTTEAQDDQKEADRAYCILTRIDDATYIELARCSYSIFPQFLIGLYLNDRPEKRLNIAQYYAGMRSLVGKPGNCYDDWKGAFSFSFKVEAFREGNAYPYILNIHHFRSGPEFNFKKVITDPEGLDSSALGVYHKPFDDEFSEENMKLVEVYMYGFLQGYLQVVQENAYLNAPDFVLLSDANHIISGYIDGQFFEHHIEDEDEFQASKEKFQHLIEHPVEHWPSDDQEPRRFTIELDLNTLKKKRAS